MIFVIFYHLIFYNLSWLHMSHVFIDYMPHCMRRVFQPCVQDRPGTGGAALHEPHQQWGPQARDEECEAQHVRVPAREVGVIIGGPYY